MTHPIAPLTGHYQGSTHLFAVRVYFEDTDLSGVTYHANYLRWFERARSDMLRVIGIDQRAVHEAGEGAYAVTELNLRYIQPARLEDDVVIKSRCTEIRAASCRIKQEAWRGDMLLCTADVRAAFVAPDGRPRRQPAPWVAAFQTVLASDSQAKD